MRDMRDNVGSIEGIHRAPPGIYGPGTHLQKLRKNTTKTIDITISSIIMIIEPRPN